MCAPGGSHGKVFGSRIGKSKFKKHSGPIGSGSISQNTLVPAPAGSHASFLQQWEADSLSH